VVCYRRSPSHQPARVVPVWRRHACQLTAASSAAAQRPSRRAGVGSRHDMLKAPPRGRHASGAPPARLPQRCPRRQRATFRQLPPCCPVRQARQQPARWRYEGSRPPILEAASMRVLSRRHPAQRMKRSSGNAGAVREGKGARARARAAGVRAAAAVCAAQKAAMVVGEERGSSILLKSAFAARLLHVTHAPARHAAAAMLAQRDGKGETMSTACRRDRLMPPLSFTNDVPSCRGMARCSALSRQSIRRGIPRTMCFAKSAACACRATSGTRVATCRWRTRYVQTGTVLK